MSQRYHAVTESKSLRSLPKGTTVLAKGPQEEYGGPHRTKTLFIYDVKLEPHQLFGSPGSFRLAEDVRFKKIRYGEPLMPLGRLIELEEKLAERDEQDC